MALQIPIDRARWGRLTALTEGGPDLDPDGVQKRSADLPRWRYPLALVPPDGRPEVVTVVVAAAEQPWVTAMSQVILEDPVAIPWTMGTRSGVAYQAALIQDTLVPGATE